VLRKGELRYTWTSAPATTPAYQLPSYTFTGQYSYMDDPSTAAVTEGFGLMFYNARWYDPALGRFAQADSIVPGGVQGLDRYAYVNNDPVRYTDPTGHLSCLHENAAEGDCDPMAPPPNMDPGDYADSFEQGKEFVYWLRSHDGWWSKYLDDPETAWKFLYALAFSWEMSGVSREEYLEQVGKAFDNKSGSFTSQFGTGGYYIYLGSLQTVRGRVGKDIPEPTHLDRAFGYTAGVWDDEWSTGPNDPYDFGNPMPNKHKEDFLSRLDKCVSRYHGDCNIKTWQEFAGPYDLVNLLVDYIDKDEYIIFFIVSYTQAGLIAIPREKK
jgi:RHS repeat-associated protein